MDDSKMVSLALSELAGALAALYSIDNPRKKLRKARNDLEKHVVQVIDGIEWETEDD